MVKSSRFNSRLLFASIKRLAAKSGVLLHMSAKWGQKFSVVESKSSLECRMFKPSGKKRALRELSISKSLNSFASPIQMIKEEKITI